MKQEELIMNESLRNKMVARIDVLEKVKKLILLLETDFATTKMVSTFYEVDETVIRKTVQRFRDELNKDGIFLKSKEDFLSDNISLKTKRGGFDILDDNGNVVEVGSNKGVLLFSKRAILRVGMLLRDSSVAKEVRTQLLNIVEDTNEKSPEVIDNIVNEMSEEQYLMMEIGKAYMTKDIDEFAKATMKYNQFLDKRITKLKEDINILTENALTISESRKIINALVRKIASTKTENGRLNYTSVIAEIWKELWKKANYKLSINVNGRKEKNKLDSLTEEEMYEVEKMCRSWANDLGINVQEVVSLRS